MRLRKVIKKEWKEVLRDKGFLLILIVMPLVLMFTFGYTFQANITDLNTIVIDQDHTVYSEKIVGAVDASEYFKLIPFEGNVDEARRALETGDARAVYVIPEGFESSIKNVTRAHVNLYLDSSDYTVYNILRGASGKVMKDSLQDVVLLIVGSLEEERDEKKAKVDDIRNTVNDVEDKADKSREDIKELSGKINEARDLIDDTEMKVEDAENKIAEIDDDIDNVQQDINSYITSLNSLEDSLNQMKQQDPNTAAFVDPMLQKLDTMRDDLNDTRDFIDTMRPSSKLLISKEYYNIGEMNSKLSSNEETIQRVNTTANELDASYDDIQKKLDSFDIELKTLKKEFLSFPLDLSTEYEFGEISYFQYLTPAIISLILFFIGLSLTTINIVNERTTKTFYRIAATPLKKVEMFLGKFVVFLGFGFIEAIYVIIIAMVIFGVTVKGNILIVFLILFLLMAASIGLGLLVSAVVKTMQQALMFLPLIIVPAMLISQTFSPLEVMPAFMQKIAYVSPILYSNTMLRAIMIKGSAFSDIWVDALILFIYALLTLVVGVLISKKRIE